MSQEIKITKAWLEGLLEIADNLESETSEAIRQNWISYLLGYVRSLDKYLQDEPKNDQER